MEQSARNKRFVVIRTNPGGNRKAARAVPSVGSAAHVQKALDEYAKMCGDGGSMTPKEREFCEKVVSVAVMALGLIAIISAVCGMLAR